MRLFPRRRRRGDQHPVPIAPIDLRRASRPREAERTTRRKLDRWDRAKYVFLLLGLLGFYWWEKLQENPIKSVHDALVETLSKQSWLLVLLALELLRQIHFFVAERWSRYYLFWRNRVFGRFDRFTGGWDPWTRFRLARVARWLLVVVVVAIVTGEMTDTNPAAALISLPGRIHNALPLFLQFLIYPLLMISQFVMLFWFLGRGGVETYFPDDINTRFDDVWGQDGVRDKIKENLIFLENPESIEERGGFTPGGILLHGPPGTGKTLLAEAAAGETGKPFVFVEPGAFINMFMGVGIIKVKSLFRKLRKLSLRYGGVVVFFDEADSLGNRGAAVGGMATPQTPYLLAATEVGSSIPYLSAAGQRALRESYDGAIDAGSTDRVVMGGMAGGGGMGTLQALLAEMSGLQKPRGFFNRTVRKMLGMRPKPPPKYRILIMMASNLPETLDPAMLRPGRIDRIYKVGYPTKEGRIRTFRGYLDKVSHELTDEQIEKIATITPYATGATIKDVVNEALINAIRGGREAITWGDIVKAKQLKEHGLADDHRYVEHERHQLAVHEASHAVAAHKLRERLTIDIATIERRGNIGGFVSSVDLEDRFVEWRSEFEVDIQVSLASLAGERMLFEGDNTSGVGGDLHSATTVAGRMIGQWGMGDTLSSLSGRRSLGLGQTPGGGLGSTTGDQLEDGQGDWQEHAFQRSIGAQIERHLGRLYDHVAALMAENRAQVLAVAHALETHLTLSGDDVIAVIDGTDGPFLSGAGYYTPEAIERLESYHAAVLDYHRRGLDVLPPLPEIEGSTGRIVDSVPVTHDLAVDEPDEIPVAVASDDAATAGDSTDDATG